MQSFCLVSLVVGDLAQMVERSLSMREALGSMPRFSILFLHSLNLPVFARAALPVSNRAMSKVYLA